MSYLPQYKVGSPLFRTLAELRHQFFVIHSRIHFHDSRPPKIQSLEAFYAQHPNTGSYVVLQPASSIVLKEPHQILPADFTSFIARTQKIQFSETFLFRQEGASVLGDGSCLLADGCLLADVTTDFHRHLHHHHLLSKNLPPPKAVKGTLAAIASPGSQNYFHWTLISLPRLLALKAKGIEPDFYYTNTQHSFHLQWLKKVGIPTAKTIPASDKNHLKPDELLIPSFIGTASLPSPDAIDSIRKFIPTSNQNLPEKIFISRAKARRRKLLNEPEIQRVLEAKGFTTIYPGELSLEQQMQQFAQAKVIVAPHGAELTNLIYCSPQTQVIELFSPRYINPCFRELAALCNLDYTAIVGQSGKHVLKTGREMHWIWSNLKIDAQLLKKALN